MRDYPKSCMAMIAPAVLWFVALSLLTAEVTFAEPSSNSQMQAYYSGNGLLHRGLYDLAAAEYDKFLLAHADHEKAPRARYGLAVCHFQLNRLEHAAKALAILARDDDFEYAAEVSTMLGQCHMAARRFDKAVEAFETVVRKHADHALAEDAGAQLVEASYQAGNRKEAIEHCEAFVSRWPDSTHRDRADYFAGLAEMRRSAYSAAAARFERLLKKHSKSAYGPHAKLLLAQCHHEGGDLAAAVRQFRRVLRDKRGDYLAEALLGLGTILRQQGKPEAAGKHLDRLLEEQTEGSLSSSARLVRGRAWFDSEDYEAAWKILSKFAKSDSPLAADALYWAAKCKLRSGDFVRAAREFERAIKKFPDAELQPEMCYDRAIALLRGGDRDAAAKALADYRSKFPKHGLAADALHLLALVSHQQRDFERSQSHVRAFEKSYPDHRLAPNVAFLAAENDYLSGNYKQAAAGYRGFLAKYVGDQRTATAKYRLGMSLYRLDAYEEAQDILSEIASDESSKGTFDVLRLALGDIHFHRGEWKQAERELKEYLADGLEVVAADDALLKLGLALQRQGRSEEAVAQYDRLIQHFADSPHRLQAIFERGQSFAGLKRFDEAGQAFETVLKDGGSTRFATPARKHLASISLRRGDYAKAAERFAGVADGVKNGDDQAEAIFQRGQALMAAQSFEQAEQVFKDFEARFASHERANESKANLSIALARRDRHEEALGFIAKVEFDALQPTLRASLRYEQAWCLRALGRDSESAGAYRQLVASKPADELYAHALLELADIEAGNANYDGAIARLQQLRDLLAKAGDRLAPSLSEQASYRLGTAMFQVQKHQEAADVLADFVKRFPDGKLSISAGFFCGEALFELGRLAQAVPHFELVAAGPKSDSAYGPSLLRLGECYAKAQQWAKSEDVFTRYLEGFGDDEHWFQAAFGVGWARENQGRFAEAMKSYGSVVARHKGPTAARAQFQIGQCLFAKKQYEDAARELVKVDILYAYPEWSAAALYEAGRCFEKLSKTAEARQQFVAVAEKYNDTRWAELAAKRLPVLAEASLPGG